MVSKEAWYAIRTKPGAQRMAPAIPRTDGELRARIARLQKRNVPDGETIIERDCRDMGYEIFMPSYRVEVKHNRTKRWFEKRFPLLVGYAFVNLPNQEWEDFRKKVDSALCILKPGGEGHKPFEFSEWAVGKLRLIEWEADQAFMYQKMQRIRAEELVEQQMSRRQIKEMFPAGRRVKISDSAAVGAGLMGQVVGVSSQGTVKTIVEMLNNSIKIDVPVEMLRDCA